MYVGREPNIGGDGGYPIGPFTTFECFFFHGLSKDVPAKFADLLILRL